MCRLVQGSLVCVVGGFKWRFMFLPWWVGKVWWCRWVVGMYSGAWKVGMEKMRGGRGAVVVVL